MENIKVARETFETIVDDCKTELRFEECESGQEESCTLDTSEDEPAEMLYNQMLSSTLSVGALDSCIKLKKRNKQLERESRAVLEENSSIRKAFAETQNEFRDEMHAYAKLIPITMTIVIYCSLLVGFAVGKFF